MLLVRQQLAFPRRARTVGRNPLPGCSLGDTTCSTLVMVTLTASSITTIPEAPEQQGAYYGLVNLTVQRSDGGSVEFTWRLPAPAASGGVTSQILLYSVPVYSTQDVVYVSASDANGYVSSGFTLQLSFFVRTALPSAGASPRAAAPGAGSDSGGGGTTRAGLIAGCVIGGVTALMLLALAAWGLTSRLRRRNALSYLDAEGGRKGGSSLCAPGCLAPLCQDSCASTNSSTCGSGAGPTGRNSMEGGSCSVAACDVDGAVSAAVAGTAAVSRAAARAVVPLAPIGARGATRQVRDIPVALRRGAQDAGGPHDGAGAAGGSVQSGGRTSMVSIQVLSALEGRGCQARSSWSGCFPWLRKPKRAALGGAGGSDGAAQLQRQTQAQQSPEVQLQVSAEEGDATPQDGSNEQGASDCSGASPLRRMAASSVPCGAPMPPAAVDDQQGAMCTAVGQEGSVRPCIPVADGQEPGTADRGPYLSALRLLDQAAPGSLAAEANAIAGAGAFEIEEPTLGHMCEHGLVSTGDGSEGCSSTAASPLARDAVAQSDYPVSGTADPNGPRPMSGGAPGGATPCAPSPVGPLTVALSSAGEVSACAAPGPGSILTATSGPPTSILPFLEGPDDSEGASGSTRGISGHVSACSQSGRCMAAAALGGAPAAAASVVQGAAPRELPSVRGAQPPRLPVQLLPPPQPQQQLLRHNVEGVAGQSFVPAQDSGARCDGDGPPSPDSIRLANHMGSAYFSATEGWSVSSGAHPMMEDVSGFAKESTDDSWEGPRPPALYPPSYGTEAVTPVGARALLPAGTSASSSTPATSCNGGGAEKLPATEASGHVEAMHSSHSSAVLKKDQGAVAPAAALPAAHLHLGAEPWHTAHEHCPAAPPLPGQQQATTSRHPPLSTPSEGVAGPVASHLACATSQPTALPAQPTSCTPPAPAACPVAAAQGTQLTPTCAPAFSTLSLLPAAVTGAQQAAGGLHSEVSAGAAAPGGCGLHNTYGHSGPATAFGTSAATTTTSYQHHAQLHDNHALMSHQTSAIGGSSSSVGAAWRLSHGRLLGGMAAQLAAAGAVAVGLGGPNARAAQEQEQESTNPLLQVRSSGDYSCSCACRERERISEDAGSIRHGCWSGRQSLASAVLLQCRYSRTREVSARAAPQVLWSGATCDGLSPVLLSQVVVGDVPPHGDVDLAITPADLQLHALIGKGACGEVYVSRAHMRPSSAARVNTPLPCSARHVLCMPHALCTPMAGMSVQCLARRSVLHLGIFLLQSAKWEADLAGRALVFHCTARHVAWS